MLSNTHSCFACSAALLLAGCTAARPYPPLSLSPSERLVEVANTRVDCSAGPVQRDGGVPPAVSAQRHVLVLSGGADNGAYTAGVLKGWTAAGTRPQFDVVSGVSTGALIAPFAFVGAEYDEILARSYTKVQASDVFQRRSLAALLWSDSLADSAPLKKQIEAEATPELLAKVAAAHAAGRRLYVGTTNLDTKRLVVWDLGAIAAGTDPDRLQLFRDVVLASASVPGFLPPVAMNVEVNGRRYTELHVDGSLAATLMLQPAMLGLGPDRQHSGSRNAKVYVIVAGKMRPPPRLVERRLLSVARESIRVALQDQFEGDLMKVYQLARLAGAEFALTAVPEDFPGESDNLVFDPRVMKELFDRGYRDGPIALLGHSSPPGLLKLGDDPPPRRGVTFTLEDAPERRSLADRAGKTQTVGAD